MIRFGGRPVPGFALGGEGDRLRQTLNDAQRAVRGVQRFAQSLTPRELVILRLGLEASHLEESVVQGDWARAQAHVEKAAKLLDQLGGR